MKWVKREVFEVQAIACDKLQKHPVKSDIWEYICHQALLHQHEVCNAIEAALKQTGKFD
jgi:hypothetical protein